MEEWNSGTMGLEEFISLEVENCVAVMLCCRVAVMQNNLPASNGPGRVVFHIKSLQIGKFCFSENNIPSFQYSKITDHRK